MNRFRKARRGSVALMVAVVLVAAFGIGALVFDIGNSRMIQVQLQGAADAAAHGAVTRISDLARDDDGRTAADLETGKDMGQTVAAANFVNGHEVSLPEDQIETGVWADGAFTPSADPLEVNAVRVTLYEPGIFAPLYSIFSQVQGTQTGPSTLTENAVAVAMIPPAEPPGSVECYLPIAIPSCAISPYGEDVLSDHDFYPSPDKADSGGWGMLQSVASASNIRDQITSCTKAGEISVGDKVALNNGSLAAAFQAMEEAVEGSDTSWDAEDLGALPAQQPKSSIDPASFGKTFEGPVLVFDASDCMNIKYNQGYPLVGFAWGVVYDVVGGGGSKFISMRINNEVSMDFGTSGGGGGDWGVVYIPPPMLVY